MEFPPLIEALLNPELYPDKPERVTLAQTHISYLFFTDCFVYKVKKGVNFGFLDFTTLERRKFACEQELKLNRRLAPRTYLDLVPIRDDKGKISLGGLGKTVEYAVMMKRLPEERKLEELLQAQAVSPEMIRAIAICLADFHKRTETNGTISRHGKPEGIRFDLEENARQTEPFIGITISQEVFSSIHEALFAFLRERRELFLRRVREQKIRDCHGDVRVEHIWLIEKVPVIIDCIEFNDRFRSIDIASDLAFLAMDLDEQGWPHLSHMLVENYVEQSGDEDLLLLLDFYKAYRAYVRGKVESFKLNEPEVSDEEKAKAKAKAERYFLLAYQYAKQFALPHLFVTCGLMGTGKSTLARLLAEKLHAHLLQSDLMRKRASGVPLAEHRYEAYGEGIYKPDLTLQTYELLFDEAERLLRKGKSVILDASFKSVEDRQGAKKLAQKIGVPFHLIECQTSEEVLKTRLEERTSMGGDLSDGRWELLSRQKEEFEPVNEFPQEEHIVVDTTQSPEECLKEVMAKFTGELV
ncbi:MAG: AAA family ATPase [Candidatus Tectomicrobia bacterium]|nr:AAA family ATPase [Candidatus Tectomicrobia bacterium]